MAVALIFYVPVNNAKKLKRPKQGKGIAFALKLINSIKVKGLSDNIVFKEIKSRHHVSL